MMENLGIEIQRHKYHSLIKNLDANVLVLTATQRLASFLDHEYAIWQSVEGKSIWAKPSIFSFSTWLKRSWLATRFSHEKLLLSATQEHILWQKIIHASLKPSLNSTESTAKLAIEALRLIYEWQLPFPFPAGMLSENVRIFQDLALQFESLCHKNHWLTLAKLPNYVLQQFQDGYLLPPKKITLLGFAEFNRADQALLQTMERLGTEIEFYTDDFNAQRINRIELEHTETEILTMAQWAKKTLEDNPVTPFIGCVVPQLSQRRSEVLRTFNRVFAGNESAFALSAPTRFDKFPLITVALKLFSLGEDSISFLNLRLLLRSPFVAGANQEYVARAMLEDQLKKLAVDEIPIDILLKLASEADKPFYCPLWRAAVMKFRAKLVETQNKLFLPSLFAKKIADYLTDLGWPGERHFTRDEIQIIQRFQQALQEFSRFDVITGLISWHQAKIQLEVLIKQILFQPSLNELAPIQIVGTLEPIGMLFTHLWVFGLNDEIWPATSQPHPFIPLELQSQFNLPHSSSPRELAFTQFLTHQFCKMSSTVIFSSSRQAGDIKQRPSRLLSKFPLIEREQLGLGNVTLHSEFQPVNAAQISGGSDDWFEYWIDENAPKILTNMPVKGGSYLFELQAACPFRAFAEIRLGATALEKTRSHYNAKERGILLHRVLELMWKELKSQKNSLHTTKENIYRLIETKVKIAVEEICTENYGKITSGFHRIENQRLINLVAQWLFSQENIRPAFDVIAVESSQQIELDGHLFNFKLDRIDELCNNKKKLIIDYKTGFVTTQDWIGERPNKMQLPLYCVTSKLQISGVVFAQVKTGDMVFKGVAEEGVEIEGVDTMSASEWHALQGQWKVELEDLLSQFIQGYAKVDPKEGQKTCRFCELKALCRVNEVIDSRGL